MSIMNYSLSGMRDFNFLEVRKRNYIINTVTTLFELYGFFPLETPSMEKRSVLLGKYGDEGDKLIYQVLKSGDFLSKINDFKNTDYKELSNLISDKALRYDLTIPFARYVVQNSQDSDPFTLFIDGNVVIPTWCWFNAIEFLIRYHTWHNET